ncbi:MAG: hypothetical protein HW385_848, partial [candidate division NC10 bacterium]|nr:hypothetical protein [candidate division NC10 bacterium]
REEGLLPCRDDESPFPAHYPAQVLYLGVVHVPLPGAFPIAVEESEVPRIERGVEGETLSGDRLYEHIRAGFMKSSVSRLASSPAGTDQAGIRSTLQPEGLRVLDKFLDSSQELGRLATVDDAVIEAERHIHHRADDDLTTPRDGPLLDLVKA